MDKVVATPADAVLDVTDGSIVALAGFGLEHRFPTSVLTAIVDKGPRSLTIVCNSLGGTAGQARERLIASGMVTHLMAAFTARPGTTRSSPEQLIAAGKMTYELIPQGTLVERCRAGGAGLAGFYTPTGVGTPIADGKELRYFDGKPFIFEKAIKIDFALLRAAKADRMGNLVFRGGSQNFNPAFAKAARVTIAEVDEIVEVGEIPPDEVGLAGLWVTRVVKTTEALDMKVLMAGRAARRPADVPRQYNGKPGITRAGMAARAARLLPEGSFVNLGVGIPTMVGNYVAGRDVMLHAENGVIGYGEQVDGERIDPDHYNAGGQFVAIGKGASFFDSVTSFEIARSGKLTAVILGGYQVDQNANLANWATPEMVGGAIGGAMDLACGNTPIWVLMEHTDSHGNSPKLMKKCSFPLTGINCVTTVITDLALLQRRGGKWVLEEIAPGFTVDEVLALTDLEVEVSPALGVLIGEPVPAGGMA